MNKITPKNTAVVLIDHQVGLLTGVRDMKDSIETVNKTKEKLAHV